MKKIFITLAIIFMGSIAYAETKTNTKDVKKAVTANDVIKTENIKKIKVYGMACPLCQSKAKTKFKENKNIKSVNVDMGKMLITLNLKAGKDISEKTIKPIIESLGLTFVKMVN